jgi:hypothetical protein
VQHPTNINKINPAGQAIAQKVYLSAIPSLLLLNISAVRNGKYFLPYLVNNNKIKNPIIIHTVMNINNPGNAS